MEGNFRFDLSANLFHSSNEVTYLPMGDMPGLYSMTRVGKPLGQIYGLDYLGIYTDPFELGENTIVNQVPVLGDAKYRDVLDTLKSGKLTPEATGVLEQVAAEMSAKY